MDNFAAVGSAIYGRLGTVQYSYNAGGTALVTGTLPTFDSIAPQGQQMPYVIFQYMVGADQYAMSSTPGENAEYMVKVVSDRYWPTQQAYAIYATAHNAIQGASLSVAGNTLLRLERRNRFAYQESKGYWHVGGNYRIDTWQT